MICAGPRVSFFVRSWLLLRLSARWLGRVGGVMLSGGLMVVVGPFGWFNVFVLNYYNNWSKFWTAISRSVRGSIKATQKSRTLPVLRSYQKI